MRDLQQDRPKQNYDILSWILVFCASHTFLPGKMIFLISLLAYTLKCSILNVG